MGANLNTKLLAVEKKISLVGESQGSGGFLNRNPQLLLISILNKTKDQSFQKKSQRRQIKKRMEGVYCKHRYKNMDTRIWAILASGFSLGNGTVFAFQIFRNGISTSIYVQGREIWGCIFNLYYVLHGWVTYYYSLCCLLQIVEFLIFNSYYYMFICI